MNRLKFETSPYLRQHAHNPVDWYAWKEEAFEKARKENKPILVSIGYSTCHWCHVMERESFEDEEVASFMNEHFVCIKVDREERPDIDHIYMEACQFFSGSGGWPLNCFLTPERKPFYAGTYFPPMPAYNRPSWLQVLMSLSKAFQEKRDVVEDQAQRLTDLVKGADSSFLRKDLTSASHQGQLFSDELLYKIYAQLEKSFDTTHGGFGGAPKFPGSMSLQWLLSYYYHTGHQPALQHALFSLDKMVYGGIYDQIGGGFARYATDRAWLIPHFEKMLYDNALLVSLMADAYRITGNDLYRKTIEQTLFFVENEMTHPDGGFYAALDADSEGEEGKFYVWTYDELRNTLGADTPEWIYIYYGVKPEGNWEGKNILWRPLSDEDFANQYGLNDQNWKSQVETAATQLLQARNLRVRPGLDDKILLGWNALQSTAYAHAYHAIGHEQYKQSAIRNLHFLLDNFEDTATGAYFHTFKDGKAQYQAFLEDYAFLIEALLEAYGLTFDTMWLDKAFSLANDVLDNFLDKSADLFYFTSEKQQDIPLRKKELYDSATPSGNSTMAANLLRLGLLFDQPQMTNLAAKMLENLVESVAKYPSSFSRWASALSMLVKGMPEVAVVGPQAMAIAKTMQQRYFPGVLWMASPYGNDAYPLLAGKNAASITNIYVCKNYACQSPVTNIDDAYVLLKTT